MLIAWLLMAALQSMVALGSFNGSATNGSSSGSNYPDPPMYIDPGGPTGPVEPLKNRFKNYQYDPPPYDLVISTDRFCRQINCPGLDETANLPCAKAEQNAECITRNAESQDQFIQDVAAEMFDCQRNEANPDTNLIDVEDHLRESYAEILNNSVRCGWWGALQSQQISESLVVDAITRAQILCEEAKHLDVTGYEEEQLVNDCINEVWGRTQMIMDDDETEYVSYLLSPLGLSDPHPKHEEIYDFAFPLLAINSDLDKSDALNATINFLPECLGEYGLTPKEESTDQAPEDMLVTRKRGTRKRRMAATKQKRKAGRKNGNKKRRNKRQISAKQSVQNGEKRGWSVERIENVLAQKRAARESKRGLATITPIMYTPYSGSTPSVSELQDKLQKQDEEIAQLEKLLKDTIRENKIMLTGNVFGSGYMERKTDAVVCAFKKYLELRNGGPLEESAEEADFDNNEGLYTENANDDDYDYDYDQRSEKSFSKKTVDNYNVNFIIYTSLIGAVILLIAN